MSFAWLKRYMPRGLFGRAALILILPVLTVQLVVSVVFVQRHFEGVTVQMVDTISRELNLIVAKMDAGSGQADREALDLARNLGYSVRWINDQSRMQDERFWYDLTGRVVVRALSEEVPSVAQVRLPSERVAFVVVNTQHGLLELRFDRRRVSASNPHQLLVNMLFFGGLFTVIAFFYLRNQLRPITRLAHAATAFGRGQRVPYQPGGAVEVRAAGTAFLDMRARIERQIEQRTRMLSGVSHDLRTPLTRMRLGLSMQDESDPEIEAMQRDVEDMQRLVDEFLSFARGDAASGDMEEIDPHDFITHIVKDARRAGTDVGVVASQGQGQVTLRPVAMRRALDNLIGNAVRYGTKAEVSVAVTDASVRFRVEDDGPGIPAPERENALRPFVRLDLARNQDKGSGVGLGLTIAADIARAHGGSLVLEHSARLGGLQADIVLAR